MANLSVTPELQSVTPPRPRGSAWTVYSRLMGYAWRYKGRLLLALFFALVIAASFGGMLVAVGTVVKITFYEPVLPKPGEQPDIDPGDRLVQDVHNAVQWMTDNTGWGPQGLEAHTQALVNAMRADKMRALRIACAIVLFLAVIIGIARFLQEYFAGAICTNITTDLGEEMYVNLMRQPVGLFEARSSGDILSRFTNDIFMVNRGLLGVFEKVLREPLKALTFLFIAIAVDPGLTLIGLCVLPPVAYVLAYIGIKVRKSVRRSLEKIGSMASVVNETVTGIHIVKGFGMEAYEVGRVRAEIKKLKRFLMKMIRDNAATGPVTEFILVIGLVVFVLMSGRRVVDGRLDAGDLVQLYFSLAMMLDPVRKLSAVNNMIQTSIASAERVFEFIDLKPCIVETEDAVELPPLADRLRFDDVHFSYDGTTEILKGLTFEVGKGEMIALVGFSGSGKSTITKLIPRFYDVSAGSITFDGVDIRRATFKSLREQISLVTQNTILFDESIRDNIAFGRADFTDQRVEAAARAAYAHDFILRLQQGYATRIGEAGQTLSGGQRQRLAIARAIIKDPTILILDEATSSLDSESERLIQEALDQFVAGRTAIVIAHRLSTIQRADRILVIDDGTVVEQGTHQELLERNGIYRRLYEVQFAAANQENGA